MFYWVRNNKRLIQVLLALIALPFAFFGVESYRSLGSANEVASVGDQKVTEQELATAMRQQQDRLRGMLGRNFDPAMLDSPEMRTELLNGLISQRLLTQQAVKSNLHVSDEQLREVIASIPAFQVDGKFSNAQYEAALRAQNMTPGTFENSLRRDLMMQQLQSAIGEAAIASRTSANRLAAIRAQRREVSEQMIRSQQFSGQVKPEAKDIEAYYEANSARFRTPEQVRVEYVILSAEAMGAEPVPAEEIKKAYDSNIARYSEPEQRQVSHILIGFKPDASAADKAKALEKAKSIAEQLKKSPSSFAELAKKNSDDPGSAAKGGDLGYFGRGMMVKPFEDAAFAMKEGELSDPVQSDFGYHIIRVTAIRPGKVKPLEQVRGEIEAELKKQRAGRSFAEAADAFSDLVYEQSDSLKPAAERFKLQLRQSPGWITREESADPNLRNPRVLNALFSDDVVKNKRNTEAIEIGPGTLLSARVIEHKPAAKRPLEEVRQEVIAQIILNRTRELAAKEGAARLAALRKGEAPASSGFGPARVVSREKPEGLRPEAAQRVFQADAAKVPAYVGVELPEGYAIYRISRVIEAAGDEAQQKEVQEQLARLNGAQEFRAYLAALRASAKVTINQELLQQKPQQ